MRELLDNEHYKDSPLGKIPKSWKVVMLANLVTNKGDYGSGASALEFDSDLPRYVRITDITDDGNLDPNSCASIERKDAQGYFLKQGDLLFARSGATVGKTYLYNERDGECAHAGYVIKFSLDSNVCDVHFVKYLTQSSFYWIWVKKTLRQAAQPNINAEEYKSIELPLPPLPEQQRIAEILDTIDEAIARTDSLIQKLKLMKAGLLNDLLTRGLDENGELRDPIKHPEQFKDSVLGRIPREWEVRTLENITSKIIDGTHFTPTYVDNGVPFLRVTDIQTSLINFNSVKLIPLREHLQLTARCKPEIGDILYSKNGTVGITKVIDWEKEFSIFVSLCLIKPIHSQIDSLYLAEILQSSCVKTQIRIRSKQMTVSNLHLEEIKEFIIPLPSLNEQKQIVELLRIYDTRIRTEEAYLNKLKLQKQGLMHDLLTGKVRVT